MVAIAAGVSFVIATFVTDFFDQLGLVKYHEHSTRNGTVIAQYLDNEP